MAQKRRTSEGAAERTGPGLDAEVMLRALSVGATTCGLGFELQRTDVKLPEADRVLVDARLDVTLAVAPDQAELFDGADPKVSSVADVHRVSVGVGTIAGRLTFRRQDVDLDALAAFAGKNARLRCARIGDAGQDPAVAAAVTDAVRFEEAP